MLLFVTALFVENYVGGYLFQLLRWFGTQRVINIAGHSLHRIGLRFVRKCCLYHFFLC